MVVNKSIKTKLIVACFSFLSIQSYSQESSLVENKPVNPLYYDVLDSIHLSKINTFNVSQEELQREEVRPYWINQIGLDKIPQPLTKNLKICIIDSGVNSQHPDLAANSLTGFHSRNGFWDEDSIGHGTHIAGIVGAVKNGYGVQGAIDNGQIEIHMQKVLETARGQNSRITDEALIEAIEICANNGSRIINMSLSGGFYSEKLKNVIDRLTYSKDIVFVAAGGNHGGGFGSDVPVYPAAYKNVIGIGAININDEIGVFSPNHEGVDFVAPGFDILSTIDNRYSHVESIYFENQNVRKEFEFAQIDNGGQHYPSHFPNTPSCYYSLPIEIAGEYALKAQLSKNSKREIKRAANECYRDGGEVFTITYDFLATLDNSELSNVDTWLSSLDVKVQMPTLLIPGLNKEEISLFQAGDIKISHSRNEYLAITGTSQAAGVFTAGLAKLWSNFPDVSSSKLIIALENTARLPKNERFRAAYGSGIVDFGKAFNFLSRFEENFIEPSCPDLWYHNRPYQKGETVTFDGIVYSANWWTKNQNPIEYSGQYRPWKATGSCEFKGTDYQRGKSSEEFANYELNQNEEIEVITVTYKCRSYSLTCGGSSGGGFGGLSFATYGSYGGSNQGGGGGGGSSSDSSSKSEAEKKKQEEYEDLKKRADNKPKKKPGESDEAYNKRLAAYYKKLAADLEKWDKKYNTNKHKQKIQDIRNRANKHQRAYQNLKNHREVKEKYKNHDNKNNTNKKCNTSGRGIVKIVKTIGCFFDEP